MRDLMILREKRDVLLRPKKFYKIKIQIANLIHPT
jgi:hypothetical protein